MSDLIRYDRDGAVGIVTINRPEKRNALSDAMVEEIDACVAAVPEDVRGVLRNNAGGHFNHSLFWQMTRDRLSGWYLLYVSIALMVELLTAGIIFYLAYLASRALERFLAQVQRGELHLRFGGYGLLLQPEIRRRRDGEALEIIDARTRCADPVGQIFLLRQGAREFIGRLVRQRIDRKPSRRAVGRAGGRDDAKDGHEGQRREPLPAASAWTSAAASIAAWRPRLQRSTSP